MERALEAESWRISIVVLDRGGGISVRLENVGRSWHLEW
jgi:hypothetical protein